MMQVPDINDITKLLGPNSSLLGKKVIIILQMLKWIMMFYKYTQLNVKGSKVLKRVISHYARFHKSNKRPDLTKSLGLPSSKLTIVIIALSLLKQIKIAAHSFRSEDKIYYNHDKFILLYFNFILVSFCFICEKFWK